MVNSTDSRVSTARLILIPAVITLAITIVRLVGELQHWSPVLFRSGAGGGGAIVGIAWLPFIFGPYFALKLFDASESPSGAGRVIGFAVLGLALSVAGAFVTFNPKITFPGKILVGLLVIVAAGALQFNPWPALAKTLVAYGYAARIPVALVMLFAMRGNWGTHYDAAPPDFIAPANFWARYFQMALVPQLIFWVVYTVLIGSLCGGLAIAIARRGKTVAQAVTHA